MLGTPKEFVAAENEEIFEGELKYRYCPPKDFIKYFIGLEEDGIDLLKKMLELDPDKRISMEQAIRHPFFNDHNTDYTDV